MSHKNEKYLPLLSKIHELALTAPNKLQIFVYYSPHVQSVDVSIFKNGWTDGNKPHAKATAYLDWGNGVEQLEAVLRLVVGYTLEAHNA